MDDVADHLAESWLPDLGDMTLREVFDSSDPAIIEATRRIGEEVSAQPDVRC